MRGADAPGRGRRLFAAVGVTTGLERTAEALVASVADMRALFTDAFGYTPAAGFGTDPSVQRYREALRALGRSCTPEDTVVLYHTGHADVVDDEHRLWAGDTADPLSQTLRTSELATLLLAGTPLSRLLVILDACFAGKGGAESLAAGMRAARDGGKSLSVITSAHPREQVRAGDFARLFRAAVHDDSTAGAEPRFLSPSALVAHIEADPSRPAWQTVSTSSLFSTADVPPFLPNPRHDPGLAEVDLLTRLRIEQEGLRAEEMAEHFEPRARGVLSASESDWRFEGRHAALRRVADHIRADGGGVLAVTGDPGSGKSAVLGRVVLLSDPRRAGGVPVGGAPQDTLPPREGVDGAVHVRRMTTLQVVKALSAITGVRADTAGELLSGLGRRRACIVIDSLDEAIDPRGLVKELIRPLAESAGRTGLRLLLGTRRHLLADLGADVPALDLDAPAFADPASVALYSRHCLVRAVPGSPYAGAGPGYVDAVAQAVADAAGTSFLVALIASTSLALREDLPDPADPDWRAALPRTAAEAMRSDLEERLGEEASRAIALLMPLAFAQGAGLPWEDVWAGLAGRIAGRAFSDADVLWLREHAGCYIVESLAQGRSVYRLYHAAMAEYVAGHAAAEEVHSGFVDFFTEHTPRRRNRRWDRAHPYARRHLATHAGLCGRLDPLVEDPDYLLAAQPDELLSALPAVRTRAAQRAGGAYRRSVHHLGGQDARPYLLLGAHRVSAEHLARRLAASPERGPWWIEWAHWRTEEPHRILARFTDPVTSLTVPEPQERGLLALATGRDVVLLDPDTGQVLATKQATGHLLVFALFPFTRPDGTAALAAFDSADQVSVLAVSSLEEVCRFPIVGSSRARALLRCPAAFAAAPRPFAEALPTAPGSVLVTRQDLRVDVWDLSDGAHLTRTTAKPAPGLASVGLRLGINSGHETTPLEVELSDPLAPGSAPIPAEGGHLGTVWDSVTLKGPSGADVWFTGGSDGTVRVWNENDAGEGTDGARNGEERHPVFPEPPRLVWNRVPYTYSAPHPREPETLLCHTTGELTELNAVSGKHRRIPAPEAAEGAVTAFTFAEVLVEGRRRTVVLLYIQGSRWCHWVVRDTETGALAGRNHASESTAYEASAVSLPSGETAVVTVGHDSRAILWRLSAAPDTRQDAGFRVKVFASKGLEDGHDGWTSSVALGTDRTGRQVAVTGGHDGRVCVWSVPQGRLLRRFTGVPNLLRPIATARTHIKRIAYTSAPGGARVIVTLGETGEGSVWRDRPPRLLAHLPRAAEPAVHLAVRPAHDRLMIATGDLAGTVSVSTVDLSVRRRGSLRAGRVMATHRFELDSMVCDLRFTRTGSLFTATGNGVMAISLGAGPDGDAWGGGEPNW